MSMYFQGKPNAAWVGKVLIICVVGWKYKGFNGTGVNKWRGYYCDVVQNLCWVYVLGKGCFQRKCKEIIFIQSFFTVQ